MRRVTLTQFLIEQQRAGRTNPDLRLLIEVVARAIKAIAVNVSKGALAGVLGEAGTDNVQGEAQKKLDVIANEILLQANEWGGHLAAMASEEVEEVHQIPFDYPKGGYLLLFDPLDGSSNIDVNISVGTIFSVLRFPEGVKEPTEACFLQPGREQVAAGYALYGPSTMLVLTVGNGVHGFTLDREMGSFVYTHPFMTVPVDTQEFAINASNARFWEPPVQRYVTELQEGKTYRLHLASMDWLHGFSLQPENINIQVHPGYEHVITVTPTNPGTYSIICNEYCGVNHHTMASRLYVVK